MAASTVFGSDCFVLVQYNLKDLQDNAEKAEKGENGEKAEKTREWHGIIENTLKEEDGVFMIQIDDDDADCNSTGSTIGSTIGSTTSNTTVLPDFQNETPVGSTLEEVRLQGWMSLTIRSM